MYRSGLTDLEAVAAVARQGSFRAAARELGLSTTALSNAVASLEQRLGIRLFNRTTRSVSLTEAGEQFVAGITPALADIQRAIEGVGSHRDTPRGTLRINASAHAALFVLKPLFEEFLHRYPEMSLEIATDNRFVDIVADGFDGGLRLEEDVPRDMIAVPIGPVLRFALVGSPGYFANRELPQTPDDLRVHQAIRSRMSNGALYRWEFHRRGGEIQAVDVPGRLVLTELDMMLEAARDGIGLAYLPDWSIQRDVAAGRLVPVLEEWWLTMSRLCFYYPSRRHAPAGLRAFVALAREVGAAI